MKQSGRLVALAKRRRRRRSSRDELPREEMNSVITMQLSMTKPYGEPTSSQGFAESRAIHLIGNAKSLGVHSGQWEMWRLRKKLRTLVCEPNQVWGFSFDERLLYDAHVHHIRHLDQVVTTAWEIFRFVALAATPASTQKTPTSGHRW